MCVTIFSYLIAFSSSSFVLSLYSPSPFCVGPNILLNIFLSNTNHFCLIFSVKTQLSDPYATAGLIRALYNFILIFLAISLLTLYLPHSYHPIFEQPHTRQFRTSFNKIHHIPCISQKNFNIIDFNFTFNYNTNYNILSYFLIKLIFSMTSV